MCARYWIETVGATGVASRLNDGLFVLYNDVGTIDDIVMESVIALPFSTESIAVKFSRSFPDTENWVIDIRLGTWIQDFVPIEWGDNQHYNPQPARLPFFFPPMGTNPAENFPGSVPNPILIRPVNDNGATIWRT